MRRTRSRFWATGTGEGRRSTPGRRYATQGGKPILPAQWPWRSRRCRLKVVSHAASLARNRSGKRMRLIYAVTRAEAADWHDAGSEAGELQQVSRRPHARPLAARVETPGGKPNGPATVPYEGQPLHGLSQSAISGMGLSRVRCRLELKDRPGERQCGCPRLHPFL